MKGEERGRGGEGGGEEEDEERTEDWRDALERKRDKETALCATRPNHFCTITLICLKWFFVFLRAPHHPHSMR